LRGRVRVGAALSRFINGPGMGSAAVRSPIEPAWRPLLNGLETVHFLAGNQWIDGQLRKRRLLGQLFRGHHGAELGFDPGQLLARAQSGALFRSTQLVLAFPRLPRGPTLAGAKPPVIDLHRRAAGFAARPYQLVWREQPPGVVSLCNGLGNDVAGHRRRVEPMSSEAACEPKPRRKLADLGHAVERIPKHP